jgi:tetratricopeptide (TPR) repeat protein
MRKPWIVVLLILAFAGAAHGQLGGGPVNVRGQILMPHGEMPNEPIRFSLTSGDGRINDIRFTDSNGRFILERLSGLIDYVIEVIGDDVRYGNTRRSFNPAYESSVRVTLNPPAKKVIKPGAISAASGYRPTGETAELYDSAMKDIEKENFDAAEAKLRKVIARDPKFAQAHVDLGAILLHDRKFAEAETVLRGGIAADPKSYVALLNLGVALNRQQKYADAMPFLREALRVEPGLVAAHLNLGIALVETNQPAEAEKDLLFASRKPGDEEIAALLYLGKGYAMTGAFPKAVEALEKFLQKAPNAANAGEVRALVDRMKSEMAKNP